MKQGKSEGKSKKSGFMMLSKPAETASAGGVAIGGIVLIAVAAAAFHRRSARNGYATIDDDDALLCDPDKVSGILE